MKPYLFIICVISFGVVSRGKAAGRYMATVQFAVQESSPELSARGRKLVQEQFQQTLNSMPELSAGPFQVRSVGNEVAFYVLSDKEMNVLMHNAVPVLISRLRGKVRLRGLASLYETSLLESDRGGYLETVVSDDHSRMLSVQARQVPLRELFTQIQAQLGGLSYSIPSGCNNKMVDWNFEQPSTGELKNTSKLMRELAGIFQLTMEERDGTYAFDGSCADQNSPNTRGQYPSPEGMIKANWVPMPTANMNPPEVQEVYFPLVRIGQ